MSPRVRKIVWLVICLALFVLLRRRRAYLRISTEQGAWITMRSVSES